MRRSHVRRTILVGVVGAVLALLNISPAFAQSANDELSSATPLTLNTTVIQDTTDATGSTTDPTRCGGSGGAPGTVWFSFTATENQLLELDLSGTDYWATATALTDLGSGPTAFDCGYDSWRSLRFAADAGKTYFFMVAGAGGLLQMTLRPAPVMTVTIDPTGIVDRQGVADVSGTFSCNVGVASTRLDITLRQRVSKTLVIEGSKTFYPLCSTTQTAWSATIIGTNGPFVKGQAEVFATGYVCLAEVAGCPTDTRSLVDLRKP